MKTKASRLSIYALSTIIITFIGVNVLLHFSILKAITIYRMPGYFYIPIEWRKKLNWVKQGKVDKSHVFLGSSISAFLINPEQSSEKILVLALTGASILTQRDFVRYILHQTLPYKPRSIWIEVNPISLSEKFISSNTIAQDFNLKLEDTSAQYRFFTFVYPTFFDHLPILLFQPIIRDVSKSILRHDLLSKQHAEIQTKQSMYIKTFHQVISSEFAGHISVDDNENPRLKEVVSRDCKTLVRWVHAQARPEDALKSGIYLLKEIIETIQLKWPDVELILWPPPQSPFYIDNFDNYSRHLNQQISEKFSKTKFFKVQQNRYNQNDFFDCIHANKSGSVKFMTELNDWLKSIEL